MKCPCCGAAELIHDTRYMPYTYKGETNIIPSVTGDFCPACGEAVLNREHGDRYSELVGLFQCQVEDGLTTRRQLRPVVDSRSESANPEDTKRN